MRKSKRILCTVAAVVLAVSLLVPLCVSAAVPKEKLAEMGFVAYQVLDRDANTKPTDDGLDDTNKVYTVNADFADFFENITVEAYRNGIRNDELMITVDENGNLKIVPNTEENIPEENVIIIEVNSDVTAGSGDVLAGVLLSAIESDSAKASDAQRLAGWLKDYAENKKAEAAQSAGTWPTNQDAVTVNTNEDGKIDIGDLDYGYWLVYSTKSVAGVSNVKVVLEVGENSQSTIDVKAEYDYLDKTVRNLTDADPTAAPVYDDTAMADAGDILEYKVEFDIQPLSDYPAIDDVEYTDFKYIFTDTLTNQRLVNYIDTSKPVEGTVEKQGAFFIKVEVNGGVRYYVDVASENITNAFKRSLGLPTTGVDVQPLTNIRNNVNGIDYGTYPTVINEDVEIETVNEQTFTIHFNWNSLKTLVSTYGAHVTFMYRAELTSDAVLKNNNKVSLNYSTNPDNQKEETTNTDTTTVYSYGLDITKTFAGDAGNPELWEDVTFNLFEASLPSGDAPGDLVEGAKIAFIEKTEGTQGDYQRADLAAVNGSYDLKLRTDVNTLSVYGLDPGYYILEEVASPNGYLLGGKVYIYIGESENALSIGNSSLWLGEEEIDGGIIGIDNTDETVSLLQIKINNKKRNFELPVTGAMGVWLFGIGGVLMLASALFAYVTLKKRGQNK